MSKTPTIKNQILPCIFGFFAAATAIHFIPPEKVPEPIRANFIETQNRIDTGLGWVTNIFNPAP